MVELEILVIKEYLGLNSYIKFMNLGELKLASILIYIFYFKIN